MLLPDARHGNAAKTVRLSPELQSSTKQSSPFARQTPPVCFPHGTAVRVCALIFAFSYSYGSTVISRFPTNRSHRLFSAKRFYRIVRTAESQLPDSDNIASGPYHFHSVHKRILLFPVLLAIPGGKRQLPDTGMLQFGSALIGMAVAGQDEFKDFSGRSVSGSVLTLQTTSSIFSAGSTQTFIVEQVRIFPPVMARTEGRVTQPAFLKRTM